MPYVTGTQITTHVGKPSPTAEEIAWAALCAAAIEGAIEVRVDTASFVPGATPGGDELAVSALTDGAALFQSKAAPHGVLSMGIDGEAVRLGADSLRATLPVIRRIHPTAGIGIG